METTRFIVKISLQEQQNVKTILLRKTPPLFCFTVSCLNNHTSRLSVMYKFDVADFEID